MGKTLQVIAFLHTILNHKELSKKVSKVLIVVPKNVVLNWKNEFDKWLQKNRLDTFNVYELDSFKDDRDRLMCLQNWMEEEDPAIMIVSTFDFLYKSLLHKNIFRLVMKCFGF